VPEHKIFSYKDQTEKVVVLKLCSDCLSLSIVLLIKTCNNLKEIVKKCVSYKKRSKLRLSCSKC